MSLSDDRRARREKVDQIAEDLAAAQTAADENEPRVNALWAWLTTRRIVNGIDQDFEWTLAHPRRVGG